MKIYLAAPLFSATERSFNQDLCSVLEENFTVYLPQRDGPLIESYVGSGIPIEQIKKLAFESDIRAIESCDAVLAVLDGRALDEGVCIEIGYSKALGKMVFGIKTDVRTALPWGNNPMIDGCIDAWIDDLTTINSQILGKFE